MDTIISKSNEKVKYIKSLNEKKFRLKYNAFYLEGIKVVNEILDNEKAIDILFIAYSKELLISSNGGKELLERILNDKKIINENKVFNFDSEVFKYMVDTKSPQGIIAVMKIPSNLIENIDLSSDIVVLDKVQDTGNVGTIIRTADAFNIKNIICIEGTADIYSPKVIRSTMGSILRTNIITISENEFIEFKNKLKELEYNIYATSLKNADSIDSINFNKKNVVILGNEANGVSQRLIELSDKNIKIDMSNNTDSLNVSIAAGIIMHKMFKK